MSRISPRVWLYYKIYVGGVASGIEHIITRTFPDVVACPQVGPWFFLRFLDEGGVHLRLRLEVDSRSEGSVRSHVEPLLQRAVAELPTLPPSPYRPAVLPLRATPGHPRMGLHTCRIEMASYEPEVEPFGRNGIRFAERIFWASSGVAMGVLGDEQNGLYSRKTLVPILMNIVAGAFLPTGEHRPFWGRYWDAWLQAAGPEADVWRRRFEAKAVELGERGLVVLTPEADLPVDAVRRITSWTKALETAAGDFRDANDEPRLSPELLAHQLAHLMNNRLGVLPLEEAYYSSLIHHALGREVSA